MSARPNPNTGPSSQMYDPQNEQSWHRGRRERKKKKLLQSQHLTHKFSLLLSFFFFLVVFAFFTFYFLAFLFFWLVQLIYYFLKNFIKYSHEFTCQRINLSTTNNKHKEW